MGNQSVILPLAFFPESGWYALARKGFQATWADPNAITQVKQSILRGPNGLQTIRVPLEKARPGRIAQYDKWKRETLQAIRTAYGTAPFFPYYDYLVEAVFELSEGDLRRLCLTADAFCRRALNMQASEVMEHESVCWPELPPVAYDYGQRFTEHYPFSSRVGILDLIFNAGPLACEVLDGKRL
jgi:hypothetical protein